MNDIENMLLSMMNGNYRQTKIGSFIVDTCLVIDDEGDIWETAIFSRCNIAVVARYETEEEAIQGHKDWCIVCLSNPISAWDIDTQRYETF